MNMIESATPSMHSGHLTFDLDVISSTNVGFENMKHKNTPLCTLPVSLLYYTQ